MRQSALINGRGSSLEFAIAQAMSGAGASVVLSGSRLDGLRDAARQILGSGNSLPLDLNDISGLEENIHKIFERAGPITILVNNGGIERNAQETSFEGFTEVCSAHVRSAFAITRTLLPAMIADHRGFILFIASMTSLIGMPQVVAYSATKSAYLGMIRSLATELCQNGFRVNGIAPGWIETSRLHKTLDHDPARTEKILARTPIGRFGKLCDIGNAAVYLCCPAADFISGVVLSVDGGASIAF